LASFKECIDLALSDKRISADVARQILSAEDQNAAIDDVLGNLSRQRREGAIQAVRIHEASKNMESHPKGLYDGLTSLMTKDPTGEAGYKNVEYLGKYYEGKYHSMFAEAMSHFKTRMLGFSQDEEGLNKLVKAIYETYLRMSDGLCHSTMTLGLLRKWGWKNGRRIYGHCLILILCLMMLDDR
jgi:hypothetical protein